ncbi:Spy/CpxP family protein refolding chaperone [bacterium]|nr:Spy/CpxP family protein refolding chaperone [bacterium]
MKKQILSLSVCLALTATSALAAGTTAVETKTPVKAPVAVQKTTTVVVSKTTTVVAKKNNVVVAKKNCKKCVKKSAKVTPVANKTATPEVTLTPEQLAKQQFEEKMAQRRDCFYNKLGLTDAQKAKAEALDKTNRESAEPLFDNVRIQKGKLHALRAKKAGFLAIYKQERALKSAKKALKAHMETSRKQFASILTADQQAKFKAMKPCKCHRHGNAHKPPMGPGPEMGPAPMGPEGPMGPAPEGPAPKCPCGK